jgi:hypothetical protein
MKRPRNLCIARVTTSSGAFGKIPGDAGLLIDKVDLEYPVNLTDCRLCGSLCVIRTYLMGEVIPIMFLVLSPL